LAAPGGRRVEAAMRSILITGASSGIGRALALEYAGGNTTLSLVGRDPARLEGVAQACQAKGARTAIATVDVRDRAGMAAWIAERDDTVPLDIVIPNAGITTGLGHGRVTEDPDAVRALMEINFLGVLNTVDPVIPRMLARKAGRIGFVGSIAAYRGLPYSPAYCASKAAVHAYAAGLRAGLEPYGITISLIAPGFVTTPLNRDIASWKPLAMDDARAARIIRRGIDHGRRVIAFPKLLAWGTRALDLIPAAWADWGLRRASVDIPETAERPKAWRD